MINSKLINYWTKPQASNYYQHLDLSVQKVNSKILYREITEKLVLQTFEKFQKNYKKVDPDDNLQHILQRQLPKIRLNDASTAIINKINEILSSQIKKSSSIEELHTLTYCAARTVTHLCDDDLVFEQSKIPDKFPEDAAVQKRLFLNSPQKFRRLLFKEPTDQSGGPTEDRIFKFWSNLWKKQSDYDKEKTLLYIQQEKDRIKEQFNKIKTKSILPEVEMIDLKKALKRKKNWSPPGIDGVQTFWYKKFKPVRKALLEKINDIIQGKEEMPEFFTVGFTELHSKGGDPEKPSNYRPITHLPAIYKIITRCVYQKIFQHYETYKILAEEQCGGRKDCFGVRKALIMDSVALDEETVHGRYVDFKKAFDSVPHNWVLELLKIYQVDDVLVNFLKKAMSRWKTRMHLKPDILTRSIRLQRGVFQGDSTSVLLFWTAINPLSFALRSTNEGLLFKRGGLLSHVLYMDDLKLYASTPDVLKRNYDMVENYAQAINIDINKSKCHEFSVPQDKNKQQDKNKEKFYLGYIQTPKIISKNTIYHKVRKFEDKCKKIGTDTNISEEDKKMFKKKYIYNDIFDTFGILDWRLFKRELSQIEAKKKFLPVVQKQENDLPTIYLKLVNDMCKLRKKIIDEGKQSKIIGDIVRNDTVTPLRLSLDDEEEYVKQLVDQLKDKTTKRKRKASAKC